jgi:hypothetical protein
MARSNRTCSVETPIKVISNPLVEIDDNNAPPRVQIAVSPTRVINEAVRLLPLPQPPLRAHTDARTNPSAQRATQLRSVLARVYAVSRQNQVNTTVP